MVSDDDSRYDYIGGYDYDDDGDAYDNDESADDGDDDDDYDDGVDVNNYLYQNQCDIEFNGASMANPGKGGAGAIVRSHDGRTWCLREGLGITTSNVAKYRGLILGMIFAFQEGFQMIYATGDSILVCNQVEGKWEIRNPNLIALNEEVQGLKDHFYEFTISHVRRELNSEAAFQADQASYLPNGQMEEEYCESLADDDDCYGGDDDDENGGAGINEDNADDVLNAHNQTYYDYSEDNYSDQCDIEYDGASKGNPGKGGAGAIVRARDGRTWYLREGLGITTSNVAEYQGLILGMKFALEKGFQKIYVTGDSLLICNQVKGKWQIRNHNLIDLNRKVQDLRNQLYEFTISHVGREFNVEADFQADQASYLPDGQIEVEDY